MWEVGYFSQFRLALPKPVDMNTTYSNKLAGGNPAGSAWPTALVGLLVPLTLAGVVLAQDTPTTDAAPIIDAAPTEVVPIVIEVEEVVTEEPIVEPEAPEVPEEEGPEIPEVEPEVEVPPVDPVKDPAGLRAEAKALHVDSLKSVSVPLPTNLGDFVKNQAAVVALGKALFWDLQAGSDGMACASCHFHAGADSRVKNQISPSLIGGNGVFDPMPTASGGPNYTLKRADFPLHQKTVVTSNAIKNNVSFDTDDVVSSGGVLDVAFLGLGERRLPRVLRNIVSPDVHIIRRLVNSGILPSSDLNERLIPLPVPLSSTPRPVTFLAEILKIEEVDPLGFAIVSGGKTLNTRRVEPRNTPTVINSIFNHRNFWDGRANFNFNGRSPFGPRDQDAKVFAFDGVSLNEVPISLDYASLASQAVGPAESVMEMSAHYRNFLHIGRKLLKSQPLRTQLVAHNDSVLGPLSRSTAFISRLGLKESYASLIQRSFHDKWWGAPGEPVVVGGVPYNHMEANFSLFWGVAIMMYERTLVSDRTPLDRFMEGDNNALNATERQGLSLFLHEGKCVNCHGGPEFTNAAFSHIVTSDKKFKLIERMLMGDKNPAIYDNGFYNINVRPSAEDVGVGGTDPFGNPLSFSVQAVTGPVVDKGDLTDSSDFEVEPGTPPQPGERVAVRGAFKTPSLRNIDLTGPYFHNGGQLTLEQVIQFYARGSDFKRQQRTDSDPDIRVLPKLNGNRTNIRALAAFLRTLTDPRVAFERAPFDHPSLPIPNGHAGSTTVVTEDARLLGSARSGFILLPVVGAQGRFTPIQPVLGGSQVNSRGIPQSDGLPAILP